MEKNNITAKKDAVALKFPSQKVAIDILFRNILSGQNTILYGKGGYGKSQLAKIICNKLNIPYITVQCYKDMPVEAFVGSLDMTKFSRESKYRVNFKDSPFMYKGVLILEEFMDVDPDITSAIKDIIEEKGYRDRDTFTPHNIQAIIAIGNTPPEEVATTSSARALYFDRFISHVNMEWEIATPNEYLELFLTKYDTLSTDLVFVAQLSSKAIISPRAALDTADIIQDNSENIVNILSSLHYFNDLNLEELYYLHNEYINEHYQDKGIRGKDWDIASIPDLSA